MRVTLLAELWREYCRVAPACLPLRFPLHLRKDQAGAVRWMLAKDPASLIVHPNFHRHAQQFRHTKRHCHRRHLCGKVTDAKIKNHFDLALPAHVRDNGPGAPLAQRHKLSLGIMIPLKEKLAAHLERPRGYCHVANILLVEGMLEQIRRQTQ